LFFSACEHALDVAHEKEGGRANRRGKRIVLQTSETQSAFSETVMVNHFVHTF
jgi:hypothetical protein